MKERCPICGAESELEFLPYEIPHFGEALFFTAVCPSCGFRSADLMLLAGEGESGERSGRGRRCEFEVSSVRDLNARVVRSSFGRIEIPELGVSVEPRRGEVFISTVEGVLKRVEKVVKMLSRNARNEEKKRAEAVLKRLEKIKSGEGEAKVTLIIDDPTGNSAIIGVS